MSAELTERVEALESHVARLEGIIHVLLIEIENGTIQDSVKELRAAMPQIED